jgi:hypothetical protein
MWLAHTGATEHGSDAKDYRGVTGGQHDGERAVDQGAVEKDIEVVQAVSQDRDPGRHWQANDRDD